MIRKTLVSLVALMAILAVTAGASQIDNEYVYAVKRALEQNYNAREMLDWHEQEVLHAAKELGFQRDPSPAEVVKLLCLIGAIDMPYVSPLWTVDEVPAELGKPQLPEIVLGKLDGSNAFDLVWQDALTDSCDYTIRDIVVTSPNNDLDQDGKAEIVVVCKQSPPRVVVFENNGDNSYTQIWYNDPAEDDSSIGRVERVEVTDLDNDGKLEIVVGVWNYLPVTPTWGCIKVFEWTGSDNDFGSSPISYFDLGITDDNLYASGFATGDLDNDGKNELVVCENRSNNTFVVSVDGTFETTPTWNIEYNNNITVGSPYAACVGDADNDGFPEFYVVYWDNLNVYTHENTGVDTYSCVDTSGYLTGSDEYSWEGAVVANFDGGYGEVYITSANFGHLWIVTNTGDVSNPTFTQLVDDSPSYMGAAKGDQDHGSGSDGGDLYIGVGGGSIYDYEFTGSDVTNIADYTFYTIFTNPNPRTILMVDVMDSLDADGEHEVVGGADGLPGVESFLFVLEHGEFATHDLGVENISPTYTAIGQSNIEATIFNHGANDESNFNIYWSTDTGDNGSELYSGTLVAQTSDDVALSWTADTTGLVNMTVWTDLAGDENALNDTLTRAIYVYPPATGQYTYKYYTESPARTRGVGVFGNDDFCVGVKNSPYSIEFYHDAPDSPNVINTYWENPGDPGDHIDLIYNWGIGVDNDLNAYLTNQDNMQSVLVFDYDGNSTTHRLELGQDVTPLGTGYPTACDIDDSGYVYVAYYVFNPAGEGNGDQIEVYDKLANWNDATHTAPLMTSFEPAAYVCEGLCVNSDGSVLWLTNRSSPGYLGNVTRWTGSPSTGYVQDTTFAGDGTMDIPGYVRGIDLAPDGDIYVCSDCDNAFDQEKVFIGDGTTGELKNVIDIDSPGNTHKSPYDLEFSLVGEIDLSAGRAGETPPFDDDIYLSWSLPTATALYITHQYGWYVDKWEGPGFKGVSSYAVYRDTLPDFVPGPGNLLGTTPNNYYLDETGAGNTSLNYYYIVKATGTPGYTSKSTTAGEFDKSLLEVKKKDAPQRTVTKRKTR